MKVGYNAKFSIAICVAKNTEHHFLVYNFQWYQLIGLSHDHKELQMIEHIKIYKHNIKLPVLNDIQYTLKVMNNSI